MVRQLGRDGWLALCWPPEYGGRGRSVLDQLIFTDEAAVAGVPVPFLTINTVGPTIMRFGTAEQKASLPAADRRRRDRTSRSATPSPRRAPTWPRCAPGPSATATSYVINGQKMWTSLIQYADYVWLACRTDPDAPGTRACPSSSSPPARPASPGPRCAPSPGRTTSATYYSDVRVPGLGPGRRARTGGWPLITNQLNHERVALTSAAPVDYALRAVCEWARATKLADGSARHRRRMGAARTWPGCTPKAEFLKLLQLADRGGWPASAGPAAASATKVFGTEFAIEAYRLLMEVLGANAYVRDGPRCRAAGRIERMHRSALILTFGGGTNEVQRDIIAAARPGASRRPEKFVNFAQNESQRELAALTRTILGELTPERLAGADAGGDRFDPALWASLAGAGCPGGGAARIRGRRWARPAGAVLGPRPSSGARWHRSPTSPRSSSAPARWPPSAPRTSSAGGRRPPGAASSS